MEIVKAFIRYTEKTEHLINELEILGYELQYKPKNKECMSYLVVDRELMTYSLVAWLPEVDDPLRGDKINLTHFTCGDEVLAIELFQTFINMIGINKPIKPISEDVAISLIEQIKKKDNYGRD